MINASKEDIHAIKKILALHVPEDEVRAFGSRVRGTAKKHSDLDIVIVGKDKISRGDMFQLKEAFQESDLPFRIDIIDWHSIAPSFRTIIDECYAVLQQGRQ